MGDRAYKPVVPAEDFVTKDSGTRVEFDTGAVRDTEDGKLRYDLIPLDALDRWAGLMTRGMRKYGERNWERGQSMARMESSALRHLIQYLKGERDEDHLAAVLFNVGALIDHEERIARGELPSHLDDRRSSR